MVLDPSLGKLFQKHLAELEAILEKAKQREGQEAFPHPPDLPIPPPAEDPPAWLSPALPAPALGGEEVGAETQLASRREEVAARASGSAGEQKEQQYVIVANELAPKFLKGRKGILGEI